MKDHATNIPPSGNQSIIETLDYMPSLCDAWQAPSRYPESGHTYLMGYLAGMYAVTMQPELLFLQDIAAVKEGL
jgi:hypothetical protein